MAEANLTSAREAGDAPREADQPHNSLVAHFGADKPLKLDAGVELTPFQIAYKTYGALNAARSNAVLICHALTGDQHVASVHPVTKKSGWWETMVGPGRPIDTERYFVICPNVVGACMGTTGPSSTDPKTGKPWGLDFPVITIRDMVRAQAMLLDHLGIDSLFSWPAARWAACRFCNGQRATRSACFRRCQSRAPRAIQRRTSRSMRWAGKQSWPIRNGAAVAIIWRAPIRGADFAVARMGAHITYLSDAALHRKFGRKFQDRENPTFSFDADFEVESYLRHQGISFVERFDANSYLYLTRAMDYFDLAADHNGVLANAFKRTPTRFCLISFTSDWLFPTSESRAVVHALNAAGARVSFAEIVTDKGHDAFLLDEPELFAIVRGFLDGAGKARGLGPKAEQ